MIAKPTYPKWVLITQMVVMLILLICWMVEYTYPDLAVIADKVNKVVWVIFLLMVGHQWGYKFCQKRSSCKYQRKH